MDSAGLVIFFHILTPGSVGGPLILNHAHKKVSYISEFEAGNVIIIIKSQSHFWYRSFMSPSYDSSMILATFYELFIG